MMELGEEFSVVEVRAVEFEDEEDDDDDVGT